MISSPVNETPSSPYAQYIVMIANWKAHICTGLGVLELLSGIFTALSLLPSCIIAGVLLIVCSLLVLAVESPSLITPFVPQLQPMAAIFENRPAWQKCAAFSILAIIPIIFSCFGFFWLIGMLAGVGIAVVYAAIVIGERTHLTDSNFPAGEPKDQNQAYSPTSP